MIRHFGFDGLMKRSPQVDHEGQNEIGGKPHNGHQIMNGAFPVFLMKPFLLFSASFLDDLKSSEGVLLSCLLGMSFTDNWLSQGSLKALEIDVALEFCES